MEHASPSPVSGARRRVAGEQKVEEQPRMTARPRMRALATLLVATACALGAGFDCAAQPLRPARMADLGAEPASAEVLHVAHWAVDSGDTAGLPFAVVDKIEGRAYVFGADGRLRGASAALVGFARGDRSVPGIGDRPISSIREEERTTPAGRYEASMGRGMKGEEILWVDYEGAVAIHRVVTGVPRERRLQRLDSKLASDRRITYGCINVPVKFFENVVLPTFGKAGGIVYVLPETRRAQDLFGSYEVRQGLVEARPGPPDAPRVP
ncbi:hypothetical protein [Ramlibacter sp.]|uniref:hypothetical protein n=1 Tax=Ramlibacter sp. TaxID=1917967 RepID=UPI003D0BE974